MNRRSLLATPLAAILAPTARAACDVVTLELPARTALGLHRALTTGAPMAGPDVEPLIASLADVLGIPEPAPAEYGPPVPITQF